MEDMDNILNQIERIQRELRELQNKLKDMEVKGTEKNGLVTTIVNGKGKIIDFDFNNGIIDQKFKEALLESINNGLEKAKQLEIEKKREIIGDVDMPDIPGLI